MPWVLAPPSTFPCCLLLPEFSPVDPPILSPNSLPEPQSPQAVCLDSAGCSPLRAPACQHRREPQRFPPLLTTRWYRQSLSPLPPPALPAERGPGVRMEIIQMLLGCRPRPPGSSGSVARPPLDLSFRQHPSASPAINIPQGDGCRNPLPAPPMDDPAPGIPPGHAAGRPSSAVPPCLSEYNCDLIWSRSSDGAVSGPSDECIVTVLKLVLSRIGVLGLAYSLGSSTGGALVHPSAPEKQSTNPVGLTLRCREKN